MPVVTSVVVTAESVQSSLELHPAAVITPWMVSPAVTSTSVLWTSLFWTQQFSLSIAQCPGISLKSRTGCKMMSWVSMSLKNARS